MTQQEQLQFTATLHLIVPQVIDRIGKSMALMLPMQ